MDTHAAILNDMIANCCPSQINDDGTFVVRFEGHCMATIITAAKTDVDFEYNIVGLTWEDC